MTHPATDTERIAYLQELMDRVERTQAEYSCAKRALELALKTVANGRTVVGSPSRPTPPKLAHRQP